ncbi:MAG: hypothetical protein CL470_08195 [Acidimicrobiaceae bacterium]|nr:hypothetical protein [Acidimicrobiaceae bacterium]
MLEKNSKTLIAIPMFNCGSYTKEVIGEFTSIELPPNSDILIIDNRSSDNSVEILSEFIGSFSMNTKLIQNVKNYGLGGSTKIAFQYAIENSYDYMLLHHGSGKADINNFVSAKEDWGKYDLLLGSRFMKESKNENYSGLQYMGNVVFNFIFSTILNKKILDLGASTNFYKVNKSDLDYIYLCSDGLTFNYYLLIHQLNKGLTYKYFSSPLKVTNQKSSLNLTKHLFEMVSIVLQYLNRKKLLKNNFSIFDEYEYKTINQNF